MKMKNNKFLRLFCATIFLTFAKMNGVFAAYCNGIFGDPSDDGSLAYMINTGLGWIRIIAPILVIVFGSIDMFKAVIASNPDQMKKAQNTLVKRILIAIGLFFVPTVVNLILDLASASMGLDMCHFNW